MFDPNGYIPNGIYPKGSNTTVRLPANMVNEPNGFGPDGRDPHGSITNEEQRCAHTFTSTIPIPSPHPGGLRALQCTGKVQQGQSSVHQLAPAKNIRRVNIPKSHPHPITAPPLTTYRGRHHAGARRLSARRALACSSVAQLGSSRLGDDIRYRPPPSIFIITVDSVPVSALAKRS